jgi:hypothetical protein
MTMLRYIPPAILFVDLVYMILYHAINMRIPHNHHYIRDELLDTFHYLLGERRASECRGRGKGLWMRVGGRGGRHRRAGAAPVAHAAPPANNCPGHVPGPCPPWLPPYCEQHGHSPCPLRMPPPPPMPDMAGPL